MPTLSVKSQPVGLVALEVVFVCEREIAGLLGLLCRDRHPDRAQPPRDAIRISQKENLGFANEAIDGVASCRPLEHDAKDRPNSENIASPRTRSSNFRLRAS